MKDMVRRLLRTAGYELKRYRPPSPPKPKPKAKKKPPAMPRGFDEEHVQICKAVQRYTMTTHERIGAAVDAVDYVVKNGVEGAIVECGVWKGGSTMAMVMKLMNMGTTDREVFLYDTFSGMTAPTEHDVSVYGKFASEKYEARKLGDQACDWALSPLAEVKNNMARTGYPMERLHFVEGKVEDTIPATLPESIAILRLDTDWYESTKHEMNHLFPLLQHGGVLIIDDYGHWKGSQKAVDEYFVDGGHRVLLNRIDYSCRMAVKISA